MVAWARHSELTFGAATVQATSAQARGKAQRIFFGWWIVGAGFIIQSLHGGLLLHGFTAYVVFLQRDFGWSKTGISCLAYLFPPRYHRAVANPQRRSP